MDRPWSQRISGSPAKGIWVTGWKESFTLPRSATVFVLLTSFEADRAAQRALIGLPETFVRLKPDNLEARRHRRLWNNVWVKG
ncbi:hypothetical protein [uncultured Agrobacterium sp.]|uniref:hypothetical protein n=1 Tax=uncultured Agrobacterium sp. TaxID=157277 RepID=UPI0025DE0C95|nr:hypothetical protein [uncultured Agrobacterium sp.]